MSELILLPAIDIRAGSIVRVSQGLSEVQQGSAVDVALSWQREGAEWIHLVDLDLAFGSGDNSELVREIINTLDIPVQLSGGIVSAETLGVALESGAARINLGASVFADPVWMRTVVSQHGERLSIALDVDGDSVAPRGSNESGPSVEDAIALVNQTKVARVILTDVTTDGALSGPNVSLLHRVITQTTTRIISSGGISSLEDIALLRRMDGVEGAIIGKALYAGRFDLHQALMTAKGQG